MPSSRGNSAQLPDYSIIQLPNSPSSNLPLIFLLEHIGRVEIEGSGGPLILTAEFRVTAITDGDVSEPSIDDEIDENGQRENAVGREVFAEPIEDRADQCTDDHDREADLGIEILPHVKLGAGADGTHVHPRIVTHGSRERERNRVAAAPALDRTWRIRRADR